MSDALREKVVREVGGLGGPDVDAEMIADAILAIPEIVQGQYLRFTTNAKIDAAPSHPFSHERR